MASVKSLMNDMLGQIDETMSTPSLASSMSSIVPASLNSSMISAGDPMNESVEGASSSLTTPSLLDESELEEKRAVPNDRASIDSESDPSMLALARLYVEDEENNRNHLIELYKQNEKDLKSKEQGVERISLPNLKVNPVMVDINTRKPFLNAEYFFGKNGELFTLSGNRPKNIEKLYKTINWTLTFERLIAHLEHERSRIDKLKKKGFSTLMENVMQNEKHQPPNTSPPSEQIQRIYKLHPEPIDQRITPWINDPDESLSFKRDDIYLGRNGELHYSKSGTKVLKKDLTVIKPYIDWNRTLELVESELNPAKPSRVNIVTPEKDILEFLDKQKSRLNVRELNRKARSDLATIFRNNPNIMKDMEFMPYSSNNDPLFGYTISFGGDRLSIKNKRTGYTNPTLDRSISWANTLKNMIDKVNRDKKKINLDFTGTNIPSIGAVDSNKRALGDSAMHPPTQKKLRGRGLRGAGKLKGIWPDSSEPHINNNSDKTRPYKTIDRKGKIYYNLHDIQGTGLQSAFTYKPLGSKYIRIPDLYDNKLNIVYPSRARVGPKRDISKHLADMIKDLVYDGKISQQEYDMLPVEDQRLFKEILAATHLQLAFRERLADPIETLKAEFHKLQGEFLLGNNNPDIIKQLKALTVDMFANKLISESKFKEIILSVI